MSSRYLITRLAWGPVAIMLSIVLRGEAVGAPARFWISTSSTVASAPVASTISLEVNQRQTLFIWAQPETDTAGNFKRLHNISLNLLVDQPRVDIRDTLDFFNPTNRFQLVRDSNSVEFPIISQRSKAQVQGGAADSILNFSAGVAQSPPFTGFGGTTGDNGCGSGCLPAWLVATFELEATTSSGVANIRLQIGSIGITHAGEQSEDAEVVFGENGAGSYIYNGKNNRDQTIAGDPADLVVNTVPFRPGDFDDNGIVDGRDFLAWQQQLGGPAIPAGYGADGDLNGIINAGDLASWKSAFANAHPSTTNSSQVPEPEAIYLLSAISVIHLAVRVASRR